jgi:hypothetical protein
MTKAEAIKNYEEAIKSMLTMKGIDETNAANHLALEKGIITLDQFRAGAQIIVKAFMNR